MISSALFSRYARALADIALEQGEEPQVTRDLETYLQILQAVPDLVTAFHSPAVPKDTKHKLLGALISRYPVGTLAHNFIRLLIDKNRMLYFTEIFDYYRKTINQRKGVISAQVAAATVLSTEDAASLRAALNRVTGSEIELRVTTEPELLGGAVVQLGSTVYDGSIRRQLAEMRHRLGA